MRLRWLDEATWMTELQELDNVESETHDICLHEDCDHDDWGGREQSPL